MGEQTNSSSIANSNNGDSKAGQPLARNLRTVRVREHHKRRLITMYCLPQRMGEECRANNGRARVGLLNVEA